MIETDYDSLLSNPFQAFKLKQAIRSSIVALGVNSSELLSVDFQAGSVLVTVGLITEAAKTRIDIAVLNVNLVITYLGVRYPALPKV